MLKYEVMAATIAGHVTMTSHYHHTDHSIKNPITTHDSSVSTAGLSMHLKWHLTN